MIKYYNLQRMVDFLKSGKVTQGMFNMNKYRIGNQKTPECNSVGCVIGWCTELDADNIRLKFLDECGCIQFSYWSEDFTGISAGGYYWSFLFSEGWQEVDNTLDGAIKRLEYVIKHEQTPDGWRYNKETVKLYNA